MNCSYDSVENGVIHVAYNNEHFMMNESGQNIIQIFHGFWYEAPLDEIGDFSIIQRTINDCNANLFSRIVYTYEEDKNAIALHTYCTLACIPSIASNPNLTDIADFLKSIFDSIINVKYVFHDAMDDFIRGAGWSQSGIKS